MKLTYLTVAAALVAGSAFAAEVGPKEVKYNDDTAIEMSLTGVPGDPAKGAEIMATKSKGNCVACHEISALSAPFQGNVGPMLDGAGDRWSTGELRGLVVNAKMMFEGSVMPSFYQVDGFTRPGNAYTGKAGQEPLAPLLSAQEIEDVVAFLATLKDE